MNQDTQYVITIQDIAPELIMCLLCANLEHLCYTVESTTFVQFFFKFPICWDN